MTKLEKIIEEIDEHVISCGGQILSVDDPLKRRAGWKCMGCGRDFEIKLPDMKQGLSSIPEDLRKFFLSGDGRIELAKRFSSGGRLFIWDEQKEYDVHDCAADVMTAFCQSLASVGGYPVPLDERPEGRNVQRADR